jgi:hypothetical protein
VQHPERERHAQQRRAIEPAGILPPQPYRQGLLPGLGIGVDVTQVVGLKESGSQQPDRDAGPEHESPAVGVREQMPVQRDDERCVLHVGRSGRRHEAEEHEDEDLAEAQVTVGAGSARVGPPRNATQKAQRDEPPGDACSQHQARQPSDAKGEECGDLDLPHGGELTRHQPDRADPARIGAPHPVRVVIHVVRAHLDPQRHHEGQKGVEPGDLTVESGAYRRMACTPDLWRGDDEMAAREVSRCSPDGDRHDGCRKRARARAGHPKLEGRAHGRRGKREKSGARCSTKAFRPSCPSSVM